MTEQEEKQRYAELLMRTPDGDPFKAALTLFPQNVNRALWVANNWPTDPDVIAFNREVKDSKSELDYLPSKADLARSIWARMNRGEYGPEDEDFVKLAKLYGDVMGFIEKPNNVTTVNVTQNRVMEVRDHGTAEQWEQKLLAQQERLINGDFTVISDSGAAG